MRIFYGFLIIMVSVGLFLLPITPAAYDFRTDVKEDTFRVQTAGGSVGNLTLVKALYNDDISKVSINSSDSDDVPVVEGYHTSNRVLDVSGLATSTNRTLTVSYDVDALGATSAIANVIDKIPWLWMIMIICFPIAAVVYIIFGMKR